MRLSDGPIKCPNCDHVNQPPSQYCDKCDWPLNLLPTARNKFRIEGVQHMDVQDHCDNCGKSRQSLIHDVDNTNNEIRMAAHKFSDNGHVAWCRYTENGSIVTCDSDAPNSFKVYRR
jgi:hypothetical protein